VETLASGFGLIEGPVWHPEMGLIFADTQKGGAFRITPAGEVVTVFEHRRGIGGMAWHESGGLVISGRNIAYKGPAAEGTVVLLDNDPAHGIVGFNDITTDPQGRIYAGALGFVTTETELAGVGGSQKSAPLFLIELDGTARQVQSDIKITNGLGFSPDGSKLYHADSGERKVYVYDVFADGSLSERRTFAVTPEGLPDGLAVAVDGSVWVGIAHGGQVQVFDAAGTLRTRLDFPLPMVTTLCFGGADMRDLYVTTGSDGTGRDDAGTVFRMRADVPGLPVPPARVKLGSAVARP
jgi:gluconolactonase